MLSVVLATYNEEKNLKDCLQSIKDVAGEIIVFDGESTDKTVEIAQKMGAKVFIVPNVPIFHINKQKALDKARGAWILQLDADERVDEELKEEIKKILNSQFPARNAFSIANAGGSIINYSGYYLKRKNFFLGKWLKKGGQYPDPVIRLVRRGHAHFPQKSVHEQIQVNGPVNTLGGHLLHYTAPTFQRYLQNANRYTSLTAEEFNKQQISFSFFNWLKYLFWKPMILFLNLYFRHKGFVDGFPGFVFALFSGLHGAIAFLKHWESTHVKKTYQ